MRPILPWSYSSLTSYETCPYRYARERADDYVRPESGPEALVVVQQHSIIEHYLKGEGPPPESPYKIIVDKTLLPHRFDTIDSELKLAITKDRKPCDWDDPNAYHRGILDVLCRNETPVASIFDWKTGKVNPYSAQLEANAITVMAHFPHINTIHTEYIWLKFNKTTPGKVFRDTSGRIWGKFVARADRLEESFAKNDWPKRPSGLCKKYCPIHDCEHNGAYVNERFDSGRD